MSWCETATAPSILQAFSPPTSLGSSHLTPQSSMALDDASVRSKRPAMPGAYSHGLGNGKLALSSGGNHQIQEHLLVDNEPSNSRPLVFNSPEKFEKIRDQYMTRACIESSNKLQNRYTYPNTFHASSSSASSDFQKSESGASYITELSTAPSTSPSPKLISQQVLLPEVKADECLSLETHEGNQPATRDDPYRNPVQIPGCLPPTFVYPHSSSSIHESYHNRFREVVNLFRRNTYEDPKLRESMRFIDYTLKLCGTSPADASPSILAFCRKSDFKALNRLLTNKELKYQYCLRRSSWRPPWLGQETAASTTSDKPLFNLYFWRQSRPRSLFWGKCHAKIHDSRNDAYPEQAERPLICGSIVEIHTSDIQFSTLGCTLQIGSEWYTTTSRHAFRPPTSTEHFDGESEPAVSIKKPATEPGKEDDWLYGSDSDPSDADAEDYLVDVIEYESLPEDDEGDDWDEEETQIALDSYWDKINSTHRKGQDEAVEKAPVIFITSEDLDKSSDLDLDWALLKWEKPNDFTWVPNTYRSPNLPSPIFISKISQSQPAKETSVLVLTSRQSPRHGLLQPGTAMLGGISGRQSSVAWIVLLNEKRSLTYGDSGALVIDALTNDIYGHVIGSNPLGEIYISPFVSVLQQIRQKFPGQALSLPKPLKMNTNASATTDDIIGLCHSLPDLPKGKGLPILNEPSQPHGTFTPTPEPIRFQHDSIEDHHHLPRAQPRVPPTKGAAGPGADGSLSGPAPAMTQSDFMSAFSLDYNMSSDGNEASGLSGSWYQSSNPQGPSSITPSSTSGTTETVESAPSQSEKPAQSVTELTRIMADDVYMDSGSLGWGNHDYNIDPNILSEYFPDM